MMKFEFQLHKDRKKISHPKMTSKLVYEQVIQSYVRFNFAFFWVLTQPNDKANLKPARTKCELSGWLSGSRWKGGWMDKFRKV